jgi:hypothetical protein
MSDSSYQVIYQVNYSALMVCTALSNANWHTVVGETNPNVPLTLPMAFWLTYPASPKYCLSA